MKLKNKIIFTAVAGNGAFLLCLGILIAYKQYLLSSCIVFVLLLFFLFLLISKKTPHYLKTKIIRLLNENEGRLEYQNLVDYIKTHDISGKADSNKIVSGALDTLIKEGKIQVRGDVILKIN